MTVDPPETPQPLSAQDVEAMLRSARRAILASLAVPDESLDSLLRVWILARRKDEGGFRPMKRNDLDMQVDLARKNAPLMAVIQAAYRMALTDHLDYLEDKETS